MLKTAMHCVQSIAVGATARPGAWELGARQ